MAHKWQINGHEIRFYSDPILILISSNSPLKKLSGYYSYQTAFNVQRSVFSVACCEFRVHPKYKSPCQIKPEIVDGVAIDFQGLIFKTEITILLKGDIYLQISTLIEK